MIARVDGLSRPVTVVPLNPLKDEIALASQAAEAVLLIPSMT